MKKVFYTNGFKPNENGDNPASKKLLGMMWAVNEISGYSSFLWDYKKISIFELYQQHSDCAAILISEGTVPPNHCAMFMDQYPEVKLIYVNNGISLDTIKFEHEIKLNEVPFMVENRHMFGKSQGYLTSDYAVFSDTLSKEQADMLNTIGGIARLRVYGGRPQHRVNNYCGILINSETKDCMASIKNVIMFDSSLEPTVRAMGLKAIVANKNFSNLEDLVGIVKGIDGGLDINLVVSPDDVSGESYQNYVVQHII